MAVLKIGDIVSNARGNITGRVCEIDNDGFPEGQRTVRILGLDGTIYIFNEKMLYPIKTPLFAESEPMQSKKFIELTLKHCGNRVFIRTDLINSIIEENDGTCKVDLSIEDDPITVKETYEEIKKAVF